MSIYYYQQAGLRHVGLWILCALFAAQSVWARTLPEFTGLVETNGPAVVNISTTAKPDQKARHKRPKLPEWAPNIPEDSPFNEFFRRYFDQEEDEKEGEGKTPRAASRGSGFIISADGYVITNAHVVEGADEIVVRLNDRRELPAKLIGSDERSDIALLKVEAQDLPLVKIGSSEQLEVGEWVLAIGSPFGFEYSATAGIVSAKGRSLPGRENNYIPFIQTDVAINPGNSGGPLFNLAGEVIGVNSQIYSRTGGFMGLSFSIPMDTVMNVVEQLKTSGEVSRGWLGVLIQDVNRELAESFGMKKPQGALVSKVMRDSPAEEAGFKPGDIIISFAGSPVDHSSDLPPMVGETKVGSSVEAEVVREGKTIRFPVTIAKLTGAALEQGVSKTKEPVVDDLLGLLVVEPDKGKGSDLPETGVLVEKVGPGPARQAGIRKGDIILMLGNVKIETLSDFNKSVKSLQPGQIIPILVQRGNMRVFLPVRVSEK
ncbi:MAG: DegQ family serine endoprotease [Gammaproteobacteria bacterium]|nr:DegQ family serine endoprotease [Gammaproteobacteria bacterium]